MPYLLLQNPDSYLAGKLDALINWGGIYYKPEQPMLAKNKHIWHSAVVLCDCDNFTPELQIQWWNKLAPGCQVIVLVEENYDLKQLAACPQLLMALPAAMDFELIRQNLYLADRLRWQQQGAHEQLRNCQRQIEELGLIGQAKKWLREQWGLNEEDAHRWLQRQSQVKQQKMINTAHQIIQGYYLGQTLSENGTLISYKP